MKKIKLSFELIPNKFNFFNFLKLLCFIAFKEKIIIVIIIIEIEEKMKNLFFLNLNINLNEYLEYYFYIFINFVF